MRGDQSTQNRPHGEPEPIMMPQSGGAIQTWSVSQLGRRPRSNIAQTEEPNRIVLSPCKQQAQGYYEIVPRNKLFVNVCQEDREKEMRYS